MGGGLQAKGITFWGGGSRDRAALRVPRVPSNCLRHFAVSVRAQSTGSTTLTKRQSRSAGPTQSSVVPQPSPCPRQLWGGFAVCPCGLEVVCLGPCLPQLAQRKAPLPPPTGAWSTGQTHHPPTCPGANRCACMSLPLPHPQPPTHTTHTGTAVSPSYECHSGFWGGCQQSGGPCGQTAGICLARSCAGSGALTVGLSDQGRP